MPVSSTGVAVTFTTLPPSCMSPLSLVVNLIDKAVTIWSEGRVPGDQYRGISDTQWPHEAWTRNGDTCIHLCVLMNNGGRRKQKTSKTTIPYSTHLLFTEPVVVPGVTVRLQRLIKMLGLQKHNKQFSIVRTYCHHYGPGCGAWKMRRQSYDTDGVNHVTL